MYALRLDWLANTFDIRDGGALIAAGRVSGLTGEVTVRGRDALFGRRPPQRATITLGFVHRSSAPEDRGFLWLKSFAATHEPDLDVAVDGGAYPPGRHTITGVESRTMECSDGLLWLFTLESSERYIVRPVLAAVV